MRTIKCRPVSFRFQPQDVIWRTLNNLPTSFDLYTIIHFFSFKKRVNDKHLTNVISHLQTRLNLWGVVFGDFIQGKTGIIYDLNFKSIFLLKRLELVQNSTMHSWHNICNEKQVIFRDYVCFRNSPFKQFTNRDHLKKNWSNIELKIPHKTQGLLRLSIISLAKQFQKFPIQF